MPRRKRFVHVTILVLVAAVLTLGISCVTGEARASERNAGETAAGYGTSAGVAAQMAGQAGGETMDDGSLKAFVGVWEGALKMPGASLDVVIRFLREPGLDDASEARNPVATMDIPAQMAYRLPLRNVTASGQSDGAAIHFELPTGGATLFFDGALTVTADDSPRIAGRFTQGGAQGTIEVVRAGDLAAADKPDAEAGTSGGKEREVSIESDGFAIHGTFRSAEGVADNAAAPLFIIVAGSGPTDRDGNSAMLPGRNDSLKQLAAALGERGISTLRYDKRGVGASATPGLREEDLVFSDPINDLLRWIAWASEQPEVSRVYLAGHSEGGLVVLAAMGQTGGPERLQELGIDPELAQRVQNAVDGVVTIAAPGRRFDEVTLSQLVPSLGETSALYAAAKEIFAALVHDEPVPQAPQELASFLRPSVYPYLRSILQFEPQALAAGVAQPMLVVGGTEDIQVPVSDAQALAAAGSRTELLVVEGMNHVLKIVPAGDMQANSESYSVPSYVLAGKLVDAITAFVQR
jgi:alpha-beta hydrolase superfamily lysophospholipase